jgi:hypothetical protein
MSQNAKQQTLWFTNSIITNGGDFLSDVCVCVCARKYEDTKCD